MRAPDIARSLRDWEGLHPAREGKGRFYPELASFLDPNNPEGYRALAARARAAAARERAKRVKELTRDARPEDVYARYALDGLDARASELYQDHLRSEDRRGELWDRWFAYMFLKRDVDAREHWLEVQDAGNR